MAGFADRVKETTTTTGTGDLTLDGAYSSSYETFAANFAIGAAIWYCVITTTGSDWEIGTGMLSNTTNFQRTQVFSSTNSDNAVNFSAGTKEIFCTIPAKFMNRVDSRGRDLAMGSGWALP